jgi:hypothetical protein
MMQFTDNWRRSQGMILVRLVTVPETALSCTPYSALALA